MKYGSQEWYRKKYKDQIKEEAKLSYREKFKVHLSLTLGELKAAKHPLYDVIMSKYPQLQENMTIDEIRTFKLLEKIFIEGGQKSIELSYKLDGSLTDITNEVDYETVEKLTEDVK